MLDERGERAPLVHHLAARILPLGFVNRSRDATFPRFGLARNAAAEHALKESLALTAVDRLSRTIENLEEALGTAQEGKAIWEGLAKAEQERRFEAEAGLERSQAELAKRFSGASGWAGHGGESAAAAPQTRDRSLQSYEDLQDWAEETLGEHIHIHNLALRDCRKNGHNNMLRKIEAALLVMRDFGVSARMNGGIQRRDLYRKKLAELSMDDCPCFADREQAKHEPGYCVSYYGDKRALYDHIRYGNGYDNTNQVRIYYLWDEERKRFVIGRCRVIFGTISQAHRLELHSSEGNGAPPPKPKLTRPARP